MLRFSLFGIPISIEWMFWLIGGLFGLPFFQQSGREGLISGGIWMAVWFLSFVIHEMGHALTFRKFGGQNTHIHLYGFGGYASASGYFTRGQSILISAAGPLVEIAFGVLAIVVLRQWGTSLNEYGALFCRLFAYICIFWGLMNLLPVLPLDGGRILEAILRRTSTAAKVGVVVGGLIAVGFLWLGMFFPAVFFGFLAFQNYQLSRGNSAQFWPGQSR